MKKWFLISGIILLTGGVAVFLIFSGSLYYKEDTEFKFVLKDTNGEFVSEYQNRSGEIIPTFEGEFVEKEDDTDQISYREQTSVFHFRDKDTGLGRNLFIPYSLSKDIICTPGINYRIYYQVMFGWPSVYCLIISQGNELVFIGITDWYIDGNISIDDSFFKFSNPPIRVVPGNRLSLRFINRDYLRATNTEIEFFINEESAIMHQGETSVIGNYKINLMVARDIEYIYQVIDGGANSISYTITRINESTVPPKLNDSDIKIVFPDEALRMIICDITRQTSENITNLDLLRITSIKAGNSGIKDLTGLEKCLNLMWIHLNDNQIENISALSDLTRLSNIKLNGNLISDISPLINLYKLRQIYISENPLNEESIIEYIPQLELNGVQIMDKDKIPGP